MVSATDGSAFTSTVTVYVTGDAGTQAIGSVGSGVCTHEGNGYHTYAPAQAETNYDLTAFTFIGTGAVPSTIQVFNSFPQTVDNATNISAIKTKTDFLPSVTAGASGGLFIAGTNAATAITTALTANITGNVSGSVGSVTGHTPQTGDSFARIGAAGVGLTGIPWNSAWDAEVQSECADALAAYDAPTNTTLSAGFAGLNDFNPATDTVANVALVATTTTNTDMRGTDSAYTGTPPTAIENADALLKRDWTLVTGAASRSVLNALRWLRNKWSVSGTTLTVTEEDDTTTAWTTTLSTDAGADPVTGSDPT